MVYNSIRLTQSIKISGKFGLTLNSDLSSGSSSGNIDTFHTIQLTPSTQFDIDHVEVRTEIFLKNYF